MLGDQNRGSAPLFRGSAWQAVQPHRACPGKRVNTGYIGVAKDTCISSCIRTKPTSLFNTQKIVYLVLPEPDELTPGRREPQLLSGDPNLWFHPKRRIIAISMTLPRRTCPGKRDIIAVGRCKNEHDSLPTLPKKPTKAAPKTYPCIPVAIIHSPSLCRLQPQPVDQNLGFAPQ